jgi:DNA-directed RNA polymerase subunit M/transcription elongation factor TFIIS
MSVSNNLTLQIGEALTAKVTTCSWEVPPSVIHDWVVRAEPVLRLFKTPEQRTFHMEEIMHYITLSDVISGKVYMGYDTDHVNHLFASDGKYGCKENLSECLQTPEQTFGEKVTSEPCKKCQSDNTITLAIQRKSADEPVSYYTQCLNCNCRWRKS